MSRLGEILTDPELDPPVSALIVWNCNPLVIVPNAELVRRGLARDDLFTVVHEQFLTDTARYADLVLPATTQLESTDVVLAWGHLWMGWNEAAIAPRGESCSNTELFRRHRRGDGLRRTGAVRRRRDAARARRSAPRSISTSWRRPVGCACRTRRTVGRGALACSPRPRARSSWSATRSVRMGQPALPTFVAAARGPARRPRAGRAVPAAAADAQAPHPLPQLRLLAPAQARPGRGGPVRRARRRRRRPLAGWPTATRATVWNDRASLSCPCASSTRLRPGVVAIPFGWWAVAAPRRQVGQRADQRHAHRVGRRRGLQRHAGAGRRLPRPLADNGPAIASEHGRRPHLRVPRDAAAAARRRRRHDRTDPGHRRRRPVIPAPTPRVVGFVAETPAAARSSSTPTVLAELARDGARLRSWDVDLNPFKPRAGEVLIGARRDRRAASATRRSATSRCGPSKTGAGSRGRSPRSAWPAATRCGGGRASASSTSTRCHRCSPPSRGWPPKRPACRDLHPAEVAAVVRALPLPQRRQLAAAMDDDRLADLLEELPEAEQVQVIEGLDLDRSSACSTRWSTTTSPTCSARCRASSGAHPRRHGRRRRRRGAPAAVLRGRPRPAA